MSDPSNGKRITTGSSSYDALAWTPDGRLLYAQQLGGKSHLWVVDADGGNPSQLTNDPWYNIYPVMSADGRSIVYCSNRSGIYDLWRTDRDGGKPIQLTKGIGLSRPSLSPDGRWVIYESKEAAGTWLLWKLSIDGGVPQRLTQTRAETPSVSPDGK